MMGSFWVAAQLKALQDGFSSMKADDVKIILLRESLIHDQKNKSTKKANAAIA
jgi:hypothetical protein